MAAGLGFKDFTTGEVLTAADVDGYLMQGIWVFASAAARDAAVISPQEGNFAYLKDTNVTTYYTGSAWANLDTTGMTNPMTTTGDIIYSSSGSTPARLGIGSTGNVLTVAGGVPSWAAPAAGGMTLLSTTTLSGATTTISSISGSYKNLFVYIYGVKMDGGALDTYNLRIAPNNETKAYTWVVTENSIADYEFTYIFLNKQDKSLVQNNARNGWGVNFYNYASTAIRYKAFDFAGAGYTSDVRACFGGGAIDSNSTPAAITSLVFSGSAGSFTEGTVLLYGVS